MKTEKPALELYGFQGTLIWAELAELAELPAAHVVSYSAPRNSFAKRLAVISRM